MDTNRPPIYPVEPWSVTETAFDPATNYRNETTFALSNGYIGTRGTFEEAYAFNLDTGLEGNFINGFYESEPIRYGECSFGFPKSSQTMLNVMNGKPIRLTVEGEPFDLRTGTIQSYRRTLHMDRGVVTRDVLWTSPGGRQIGLHTERLVSLSHKRLMAIRYEVTPINFSGTLKFVSLLDSDVYNHTRITNPLIDYGPYNQSLQLKLLEAGEKGLFALCETVHSGLSIGVLCGHHCSFSQPLGYFTEGKTAGAVASVFAAKGESLCLEKQIAYTTSRDEKEEPFSQTLEETVALGQALGYKGLATEQEAAMKQFWNVADVGVRGNDALLQGLRFNLFHIMQSAGRDGHTGMGAKGLSGEGYEGHYFWDTEMYILPVFIHTVPALAKALLEFRYNTLEQARTRAREMGHPKGALFPWRTINGTEASSYYPLGSAQYHINADIAYAFAQYTAATGDEDFLVEKGAEVLCETARVWADVGSFAESRGGKYCICSVTGPDEYNALVDNNFYTNLMARENLRDALEALRVLEKSSPLEHTRLINKLELSPEEPLLWKKIADNLYLPYEERLGIYPQDDGFLQRKPWDETKIPPEKRHLLYENYHPLFVFRHQMSKQADAILGMYLHDDQFTLEELKRNFDYYQTVTLHHSSLSTCVFGMLACRIGYEELAADYFSQSARMDLDDSHNNFFAGIHAANMAGTWLTVVNGFGGMRTKGGNLMFRPLLPTGWEGFNFRVRFRGAVLEVDIQKHRVTYTLVSGESISFSHRERGITLKNPGEVQYETL